MQKMNCAIFIMAYKWKRKNRVLRTAFCRLRDFWESIAVGIRVFKIIGATGTCGQ